MKKYKRIQRVGALVKIFTDTPNHLFSYNYFAEKFNAAKSTISEDIVIVKEIIQEMNYGKIETVTGASGGAIFLPSVSDEEIKTILEEMCDIFSQSDRIIPGGFIYMTDLFNDPHIVEKMASIIITKYEKKDIDYIVTVETKGIPLAIMCGKMLNVPVAVIRRNNKITEGATVSINYVSGSSNKIQTMSLSKRSLKENSKVLIIDDFMKGGGTAKGICDMMQEFNAQVIGTAVVIETKEPAKKLVDNYISLLVLDSIDVLNKCINISPNNRLIK